MYTRFYEYEGTIPTIDSSKRYIRKQGIAPAEMSIIGIQPKSMGTGIELSEEIKDRMEELIKKVLKKLNDRIMKRIPDKN